MSPPPGDFHFIPACVRHHSSPFFPFPMLAPRHNTPFLLRVFFPSGIPLWICPLLIPVEIISFLARPVSLAIRLTANMMAGHSMLKIFAYFTAMAGVLGVLPLCVNIALLAFEMLVAFLQAYVFTMLSCIYLHDALEMH